MGLGRDETVKGREREGKGLRRKGAGVREKTHLIPIRSCFNEQDSCGSVTTLEGEVERRVS